MHLPFSPPHLLQGAKVTVPASHKAEARQEVKGEGSEGVVSFHNISSSACVGVSGNETESPWRQFFTHIPGELVCRYNMSS